MSKRFIVERAVNEFIEDLKIQDGIGMFARTLYDAGLAAVFYQFHLKEAMKDGDEEMCEEYAAKADMASGHALTHNLRLTNAFMGEVHE